MVIVKKNNSVLQFTSVSLKAPDEHRRKKTLFRRIHWQFNKKAKCLIVFAVIAVVLISCFALLYKPGGGKGDVVIVSQVNSTATPPVTPKATSKPSNTPEKTSSPTPEPKKSKPKPVGLIESASTINSTIWKEVATNAWAYFQPGIGVDNITGLPYATTGGVFEAFTDWDLGSYIEAIVDASQIGLINSTGAWGFDARIGKVLSFLETRPLNTTTNWPFWFYNSTDGQGFMENTTYASDGVDVADTGALFVALSHLIAYNDSYEQAVDNFVFNVNGNRSNYADLVPILEAQSASNSIYSYYIVSGFESFWPQELDNIPNQILTNIINSPTITTFNVTSSDSPQELGDIPNQIMNNRISSPTITTFNVTLPNAQLTCEPLLLSIFELNNNDSRLMNLMNEAYLAQEVYANATNQFVAFSEGPGVGNYIYEWIVNASGSTWTITTSNGEPYSGNPIIYNKVAFSFLALYNSTYARDTLIFLEQALPAPIYGYYDGADVVGNALPQESIAGNSMILDAALYALQK